MARRPRARKAGALIVALLAALAAFGLVLPAPASAEGTQIKGKLTNSATREPVAGAVITVVGPEFSGQATSAADGAWSVDVPGEGQYEVTLDTSTLPSGISLTDPTRQTTSVKVFGGRGKTVIFKLSDGSAPAPSEGGESAPAVGERASVWSTVPQLAVDGLIFGIVIALAAVGLSLVFGTTKLTNFAHGELVTLGAMLTFFFSAVVGLPLVIAAVIAVIASALIGGWAQNEGLWKRLRKRGTGLIAALVVSIGLGFLVRYFFLFVFGGQTRQLPEYAGQAGIPIGPVLITPKDLIAGTVGIVLIAATTWWLLRTKAGKATRAVADNPALASASGIDVERVIRTVWILGAGLAGFAGVMLALQAGVSWYMGFQILLLVFAGSVLGGLGTAFGAILGSILVGLFIQLSTIIVPTELKYVGALAVLILILLVRPQGILGRSERIG